MKRSLMLAISLILFSPLPADAMDEIQTKKVCEKWVQEGGSYLLWAKDWKKVDGGLQRKWKSSCEKRDNLEETSINN